MFSIKMNNRYSILLLLSFFMLSVQAQEKDFAYYKSKAPFSMPDIVVPSFSNNIFSIVNYGAIGDGQTLNTDAFAKAINACNEAGGGQVFVPAGIWITGPIEMKSNVNLHLERGALVSFTKDLTQYPMIKASSSSKNIVTASPVHGYSLKNIAITGEGILDGSGEVWRPVKKEKKTAGEWKNLLDSGGVLSDDGKIWWPSQEVLDGEKFVANLKKSNPNAKPEDYIPARTFLRPYMVYFVDCENVLVEGVTIRNSPKFVFYPNNCNNVTIRYATIFNEWWAQNGDGIDISACQNVFVYRCNVSVGDDGICMKSSTQGKRDDNNPNLKNVIIAGCNVYHAHGGFVIGSNTDGGMENVFVNDCNFVGSDIGIRVKSNAGRGGQVKNIYIQDIYMKDIADEAISFDTYYQNVPAGAERKESIDVVPDKIPDFSNFHIKNIYCADANGSIFLRGLPENKIHDLYFENVTISSKSKEKFENTENISLKNVNIIVKK